MNNQRTATAVDQIADDYLAQMAQLSPIEATTMGVLGHDGELDDLSPEGHAARFESDRQTLAALSKATADDAADAVTIAAMRDRLGIACERYEAGELLCELNNIESPLQRVRDVFDLMGTKTLADWETISERLAAVPAALAGYRQSLALGAQRGLMPARRQVELGLAEANELAADGSFFDQLVAPTGIATDLPESLHRTLVDNATAARAAYGELAAFLGQDLAPQAPAADAVGPERYALGSRYFVGATLDLVETYQWGLAELDRLAAEQAVLAAEIAGPGATVAQARAVLEADPAQRLHGPDELQRWMTEVSNEAMSALAGTHFDIPEPVRALECRIAPTHSGAIYYTGPSEDFTRPGRMWWSVPEGVTDLTTWKERTTVYHEGVPGHHLQIATTVYRAAELNRWRRMGCWVSGHGEGWALYAERLMDELGYLADPGDRFGMVDSQRFRAARVVLDIGLHLELPCPAQWGGGVWNAAKGLDFLRGNYSAEDGFIRFELNRYLGWPGQAPSYKVGQRLWEDIRDEAKAAAGASFDLKSFHNRALALGALPLEVLRQALSA